MRWYSTPVEPAVYYDAAILIAAGLPMNPAEAARPMHGRGVGWASRGTASIIR